MHLDEIRDLIARQVNVETYLSELCDLRPGGPGRSDACCPWHRERTPSLKVDRDTGTWRCFGGCDVGGDLLAAVMRQRGCDLRTAIAWTARRYRLAGLDVAPQVLHVGWVELELAAAPDFEAIFSVAGGHISCDGRWLQLAGTLKLDDFRALAVQLDADVPWPVAVPVEEDELGLAGVAYVHADGRVELTA